MREAASDRSGMGGTIAENGENSNITLPLSSKNSGVGGISQKEPRKSSGGSIPFARLGREPFLKFIFLLFELFGFGQRGFFVGDVGPDSGIFPVHFQIFFSGGIGVRDDRFNRAFGFANAAVNALVRVDDQGVFPFVETIYGANFDAIRIFALDANVRDDKGHFLSSLQKIPATRR